MTHHCSISVLTPSYKRGIFLPNVWRSLLAQTQPPYEWIVGIDGDYDDSKIILADLARFSPFNITILTTDLHVGKSVIDNYLVREASGNWLLWCDSDDALDPFCIETIQNAMRVVQYDVMSRAYCVLADFASDHFAARHTDKLTVDTLANLKASGIMKADAMMCVRAETMKSERFPELDFYCPEGVIWSQHNQDLCIYIHSSLLIRRYLDEGITKASKIRYPNAKRYVFSSLFLSSQDELDISKKLWYALQAMRFGIHSGESISTFCGLFRSNSLRDRFLLCLSVFLAVILVLYDLGFRRVEKSHRIFLGNLDQHKLSSIHYKATRLSTVE